MPYIYVPHKVCDEVPATLLQCSFNSPNPQFSALVETSKYERSTCLIGLILKHCRQGLREGETIRCLARLARLSFYWLTNIAPIAQLPSRFSTFYFPRNQLDFIIQHNRSYLGYLCHVQLNRRSRDTALLGIMYEKWNLRQVRKTPSGDSLSPLGKGRNTQYPISGATRPQKPQKYMYYYCSYFLTYLT